MKVSVRLPSGETLGFEGDGLRLEDLEHRIEERTSIPVSCQEVLHADEPLRAIPEVEHLDVDLVIRVGGQYAIASARVAPLPGVETLRPARSIEEARDFEFFLSVSRRISFWDNRSIEQINDISTATASADERLRPYRARAEARRARLIEICSELRAGPLLAMTFNAPFATLFENWHQGCRQHGIDVRRSTIVFPMDEEAKSAAERLGYTAFFDPESYGEYEKNPEAGFGSGQWVHCLFMKNAVMGDMLATGRDVLFQDADVVWRRDPLPYLRDKANLERWDFMFQKGALNPIFQPLHYNSGFVYARNNEFSRLTWERVLDNQRFVYVYRSQQAPLNIMMSVLRERGLRTCSLDESLFVNGHMIPVNPKPDSGPLHPNAFMIHFNWNDGLATKLDRLRDNGVWYLDDEAVEKEEPAATPPQPARVATANGKNQKPHPWHALCLVSHKLRCIYVSIAKNASSTIRAELRRRDSDVEEVRCTHVPDDLWHQYTAFAFLRDPVSRVLAAYQEISMRLETSPNDQLAFAKLDEGLGRFHAFLDRIEEEPWDPHVCRQTDMIADHSIGFWGRVETLEDDFARLSEKLGLEPPPPLPRRRSRAGRAQDYGYSKHLIWEKDLPLETVRRIQEIYASDLRLLERVAEESRFGPDARSWTVPIVRRPNDRDAK
jgi:hypothetical protein